MSPVDVTRRGLIGGALAAGAAPVLIRAGAAQAANPIPRAEARTVRRGRAIAVSPRGDRTVVAHDARRTVAIHGRRATDVRLVDVGGQPLAVAVSPDGRLAAVSTAFWEDPALVIVDLRTGKVRHRVSAGPAPGGVVFTPDSRRVLVAGGEQEGTVHVVDVRRGVVLREVTVGTVPRGIAVMPDGRAAWVAVNGRDRVVRVDVRTARVTRVIAVPPLPEQIAVSPDGRRLLVSHGGRRAERVSEVELGTGKVTARRAGLRPVAVAWTRRGGRVVALGGEAAVVLLRPGRRPRRLKVGGAPRGLAVAGTWAWTVDGLTGDIDRVRT